MSELQEGKDFQALRIVSLIFRGLAYLGLVSAILVFIVAFISALTNSRLSTIGQAFVSGWFTAVGPAITLTIMAFVSYVYSQIVDLFLSMHEHLKTISQNQGDADLLAELKRTNGLLQVQYKRLNQINEHQQRRIEQLEQARNP